MVRDELAGPAAAAGCLCPAGPRCRFLGAEMFEGRIT